MQSLGYSLFKWLKLHKLYVDENPFDGSREGAMVELLGGPQPPPGHWKDPEPDDLPLVMVHLRTPPTHADDVCTVNEAAEATNHTPDAIRKAVHRGLFPGAYKWADWGTATYLIPVKELVKVFPLVRPLRKDIEISIESLALQFTLMTVVRPNMACHLHEDFINERRSLITYPKSDHKTGERMNDEYNVIYTPDVREIVGAARAYKERHGIKSDYLFVKGGSRTGVDFWKGELVKKNTLWRIFRTLLARIPDIEKRDATLHASRDSFVEWACDRNKLTSPAVADAVLGHVIKGITNKAYFKNVTWRDDVEEIVTKWQNFLLKVPPDSINVIPFKSQPMQLSQDGKKLRPWQPHLVSK
jgi:hypothetical protein